jgi:uncharacterized membrane protein YeaQ/YmgE (transglycosylase-associated protein family)
VGGIGFIIALIVTGLIVGALARLIVPGRQPMGIGLTILIGIAGSLLGGFVGRLIFGRPGGFILAVVCAALIVWLLQRARRPTV